MNVSDILALARAGFSAQQIAALSGAISSAPAADPAPAPAPATPAAAPATPAAAPAAAQTALATATAPATAPAAPDATAEILKQLGIISTQLTTSNIMGSTQPAPQSADQILAAIIAPPKKEA